MKKLVTGVIIFLGMLPVLGQETAVEKHLIDLEMESCIKRDSTQSEEGIARCEIAALKAWKGEVNNNFEILLGILAGIDQNKLKEAQKQWLLYADTEGNFARNAYNDKDRFPYGVVPISRTIDIWRQRAADLKEYYDLLCGNKK